MSDVKKIKHENHIFATSTKDIALSKIFQNQTQVLIF